MHHCCPYATLPQSPSPNKGCFVSPKRVPAVLGNAARPGLNPVPLPLSRLQSRGQSGQPGPDARGFPRREEASGRSADGRFANANRAQPCFRKGPLSPFWLNGGDFQTDKSRWRVWEVREGLGSIQQHSVKGERMSSTPRFPGGCTCERGDGRRVGNG